MINLDKIAYIVQVYIEGNCSIKNTLHLHLLANKT